ncbi:MAG: hypothetical protein QOE45_2390 [Frankiaceae bacterium]|jgi:hypothetical protein|nr:hypothetical protein [Frankiaceae bacterium]
MTWTLAVDRDALDRTHLLDTPTPRAGDGETVLRVDRVGVTANNVTYAVLGDAFRYWEFFPAPDPALGLVPLWGFAEVLESRAPGVEPGQRLYGYLPPSSHLRVRPDRVDERGFRDASEHRAALPSPYNAYALTTGDTAYEAHREDLQVLYRPLFFTSFMLADRLRDNGFHHADVVAVSSASSKTAYGAAFLMRGERELVGLTSARNVAFTESLGVYDRVLPYDAAGDLKAVPTTYVDVAGSKDLTAAIHDHLGADLVHHAVVGITFQDPTPVGTLQGARPTVFFAPEQMRKRAGDWGRAGLDERFGEAWRRFAPAVEGWVDVVTHTGPEALARVWRDVLAGRTAPRDGHVVTF